MHYMINSYNKPLEFEIPESINGKECHWKRWIDTYMKTPEDIQIWHKALEIIGRTYNVSSNSIVILVTLVNPENAEGN